jgi:hypothetical protein
VSPEMKHAKNFLFSIFWRHLFQTFSCLRF